MSIAALIALFETRQSWPMTAVTPLYGFSLVAESVKLGDDTEISPVQQEEFESQPNREFAQMLHFTGPSHLLRMKFSITSMELIALFHLAELLEGDAMTKFADDSPKMVSAIRPVTSLVMALHLFKPGRLVAGDTVFSLDIPGLDNAGSVVRCSEMVVDYIFTKGRQNDYHIGLEEVEHFLVFKQKLDEFLLAAERYPQIRNGMSQYARESARYGDAIALCTALEGLVTREGESIAFQMSHRVANLLGSDGAERREIAARVKRVYDLRSRLVHGSSLKQKELDIFQDLNWFREVTRRVLLSMIALAEESIKFDDIVTSLAELGLDDDLRRAVRKRASSLLHI